MVTNTPFDKDTRNVALRVGQDVYDADDRTIGTIDGVDDDQISVNGQQYLLAAFQTIHDHLHIVVTGNQTAADKAARVSQSTPNDTLTMTLAEERLNISKRQVQAGEVLIRKSVVTEEHDSQITLNHEDIDVEHVTKNEVLSTPAQQYMDGDVLVIPIMREEVVVTKRLILVEEVRIRRRVVTEEQVIHETIRRERLAVERQAPSLVETTGA